ncbi:MAG: hypothetical protein M3N34_09035 [Pseudomonadota bacterium]|nr:hypothetical protein [Pseudomonadota bacterium]
MTQWLELPDGQHFFSIVRTIYAGGGRLDRPVVERRRLGLRCPNMRRSWLTRQVIGAARCRSGLRRARAAPVSPWPASGG